MKQLYVFGIATLIGGLAFVSAQAADEGKGGKHGTFFLERFDADKDGQVSLQEFEDARNHRFEDIDSDGSGGVTLEEMRAHREKMRQEREARRFAKLDADGSGEVSEEEFQNKKKSMFERLDKNGDGVIEKSELPKWGGKHHGMGQGPQPE